MSYVLPATMDMLVSRYNEPHRHYHNMDHINASLAALDRLASVMTHRELQKSEKQRIGLMIWFHDAVYEVGPDVEHGDNEEESASMFLESPDADLLHPAYTVIIHGAILDSANHAEGLTKSWLPKETQIFLDIDLCGMGLDYQTFLTNGKAIREEYSWVGDDTFATNRNKFFRQLLKRPYIYYHHVMRGMYEEKTRENINKWLSDNE